MGFGIASSLTFEGGADFSDCFFFNSALAFLFPPFLWELSEESSESLNLLLLPIILLAYQ